MNTGRMLAWIVGALVGLVIVGAVAIWLVKVLLGFVAYLIVGALVVGGAVFLYRRVRRSLGHGTRTRNRIEAAAKTYRMRDNG